MIINNEYEIGQVVYLKTDAEQCERIVCGLSIVPGGLLYKLAYTTTCSDHYGFEISKDKDIIKATTN